MATRATEARRVVHQFPYKYLGSLPSPPLTKSQTMARLTYIEHGLPIRRHPARTRGTLVAPPHLKPTGLSYVATVVMLIGAALSPYYGCVTASAAEPNGYAELRFLDAESGRGIPLVELETVHRVRFVTDNAGRVAIGEPELLEREVFFSLHAHGFVVPKDGFGFSGIRVTPSPGKPVTVKLQRKLPAERLCRLTGEGLYRDSLLLGHGVPKASARALGDVAGQDSVQVAKYRNRLLWIWGDTSRLAYPLGLFRASGARSDVPKPEFDPGDGIRYEYFVDAKGFSRAMIPLKERPQGVIWLDGLCTVPDANGRETLIAHYSRRKSLAEEIEHGLARFDDATETFEPVLELPLEETWRFPHGHPISWQEGGKTWLLFGKAIPNVRVPATWEAVRDVKQYESFVADERRLATREPGESLEDPASRSWRWQSTKPPYGPEEEHRDWKANRLTDAALRFTPRSADDPAHRIRFHTATVRWNAHRQCYLAIGLQYGGKASLLGEVWAAAASHPCGPFPIAVHIATHDRYSFYNVCHHDFLDREGGRIIHFEGTYTAEFSGNPLRTPRYDYNQILYRLDLDAAALKAARAR